MSKAVVLFSGGQDSTTCLYWALPRFDEVIALSVFYGQKHVVELDAAKRIAASAGVEHIVSDLTALGSFGGNALTDSSVPLESGGGMGDTHCPGGLPTSFVPGRNLLLMSLAGSLAAVRGAQTVVSGVCQTDFSGYPDCRREFVDSLERALDLAMPSSAGPFRIETPLMYLTKAESVALASALGPECWSALGESVTCYNGEVPGCGECPACELRAKGFEDAGLPDPQFEASR